MQKDTMGGHLGIEFTGYGDDFLTAIMPVSERTQQPMGLLHGGVSVALAETLGSIAAWLCVDDPTQFGVVGVEINANHLSAAKSGQVIASVKPIKLGRRLQVWSIDINQDDRPICISRLTTMTIALN